MPRFVPRHSRTAALTFAALIACGLSAAAESQPISGTPVATMKAIRFHAFGNSDVLIYEDAPKPPPGPGEMLVRVHAAGVNPVDWKIRMGRLRSLDSNFPQVPGFDVSGVVAEVGDGVSRFKTGDAVFAYLSLKRGGAYAEYAIVREDEAAFKPAKVRGATVIGTASAANHEFLKELGADRVVDYRNERFEERVGAILVRPDAEQLTRLAALVDEGKVKPVVSQVLPLAEARRAHELSQGGRPSASSGAPQAGAEGPGRARPCRVRIGMSRSARAPRDQRSGPSS